MDITIIRNEQTREHLIVVAQCEPLVEEKRMENANAGASQHKIGRSGYQR